MKNVKVKRASQKEKLLHKRFVDCGAHAKGWMRRCVMLLPEIERHSIWKKKGFGSIYEYAAKLAGMSKNAVDDALRILGKLEGKPKLWALAEAKGLGAVRPVVTIATQKDDAFWAKKAESMSKHTLETYVREFKREFGHESKREFEGVGRGRERRAEGVGNTWEVDRGREQEFRKFRKFDMQSKKGSRLEFGPGTEFETKELNGQFVNSQEAREATGCGESKLVTLSMELDPNIAEELKKLKGKGNWNTLMRELLELRKEKLASEEPEPVETTKRYIPARIKKHVLKKTNGNCAYPGCCKPGQILHHTQRFALQKVHDPKRLKPLCKSHEAIAHLGLIENEQQGAGEWRLRKEPDTENPTYEIDRMVMGYRARG